MQSIRTIIAAAVVVLFGTCNAAAASIARTWNEEILAAIRIDLPHPPVHARNLFHLSVVMYDAWAAYDPTASGYLYHAKHTAGDVASARREAISYAAFRLLSERYALSRNASNTLAILAARMDSLGYPTNNTTLNPSTPAGLGNAIAALLSAWAMDDGARQSQRYADKPFLDGGYAPLNLPLITGDRGTLATLPSRWQPLAITNAVTQNELPADVVQPFLGAQWLFVRPFALQREDATKPWIDPGPHPQLNMTNDAQYRAEAVDVIRKSSELDPNDGVTMDISPGVYGNNPLGQNSGTGHSVNPATGAPYPPNVVKRGDFARVLAEFWADGPQSETPPGHWNTIANAASEHPAFVRRIGGTGPVLDALEWDVKCYFALNAALHDAACAAWALKRYYDSARPITMIRYMGDLGQSSSPGGVGYHPNGLPLVPGLIEVVTPQTSQPGQRHFGFPNGVVVIKAWPGQPSDPTNTHAGAQWHRPGNWFPYQKKTFVSPAFPGYVSGHSTFSRAAAEVLTALTGSPFFPGGLGTFTANTNAFLTFERGPSQTVALQWGTYYDAADQAGLSRLWGGIHVSVDDLTGRTLGAHCGTNAWALARSYFDGSISNAPVSLAIERVNGNDYCLRFTSLRGCSYDVHASTTVTGPYNAIVASVTNATDSVSMVTNAIDTTALFFRVKMQ